ncbi:methyl-accepting chemotaxis protein [uncultured Ferrovibrio sp.]|jgi:methyl-accepting chemotaxis protein|uniref:methyl-accepting chemotaxis protein n=1 Tax=uncultured Ferrovibrio sp. TaxID=1576913 RepID=UPI002633FDB4|nr:methyl-accepting chemotaxis protein [uncultured Ferrovibrio sp.]
MKSAIDGLNEVASDLEKIIPLYEASQPADRLAAFQGRKQRLQTFVQQRREIARLAQAEGMAAARAYADRPEVRDLRVTVDRELDEAVARNDAEGKRVQAELAEFYDEQLMLLIVLSIGIIVLALITGFCISIFTLTRPINRLSEGMKILASGDVKAEVFGLDRKDEIGEMGRAVQVFKDNMIAREKAEAEIAEQRRVAEEQRSAREARERKAIEEISALCEKAVDGDLSMRIDENGKEGFLLAISQRLNGLTAMLQKMTNETAQVTAAMAQGDLTNSIRGEYQGVFGTLKDSVNAMAAKLRDIAGKLNESARAVKDAAGEISAGSQDLAQRTESQAASIEETAASMHEITTTVKQNADNAAAANQLALVARDAADKGGSVMNEVVNAMGRIEGSASKISDIVGLIDEIAFQTNLLALNASVEAARAGEAGKGFAVVAQEVRALAQRSANASKEIKTLITESNGQVREGGQLVSQAGNSLADIVGAVKKVSDIVAEITAASREQATGLEQINTAVGQMDETTQRNGALVEQTSAAAQSLAQQSSQLSDLVGFFKIGQLSASTSALRPANTVSRAPAAAAKPKTVTALKQTGSAAVKAEEAEDWQEF